VTKAKTEREAQSVTPEVSPLPTPAPILIPHVSAPVPKPKVLSVVRTQQGKGGQEHQRQQHLLARWAQGMGYRATIEMPTADGGSIDVRLKKAAEAEFDAKALEHVRFMLPEEIFASPELLEVGVPTEQMTRGYNVRVTRKVLDTAAAAAKRQAISQVLMRAAKKTVKAHWQKSKP